MASVTVSSTTPTKIVEGGEGTAGNPTQATIRFKEGVTGTIYLGYAPATATAAQATAAGITSTAGYEWPDTEVISVTLIAGQALWGLAASASKEVRTLTLKP